MQKIWQLCLQQVLLQTYIIGCELDASFKFKIAGHNNINTTGDKTQRLKPKSLESLGDDNNQIEFSFKSLNPKICDLEVNGVIE